MALTVVEFETVLTRRIGALLTTVGLDGSTIDGNNPDLVDPMAYSIRQIGGSVTTITDVIDADLTEFSESQYDELFDVAELRALRSAYSAATGLVDTKIGPRDEKRSTVAANLDKLITAKEKEVEKAYGVNSWTLSAEIVEFDFDSLD